MALRRKPVGHFHALLGTRPITHHGCSPLGGLAAAAAEGALVVEAMPPSAAGAGGCAPIFVNQSAVIDRNPPTDTASSVRVMLDKISGHWLISGFDPV
jgi:hypothetical protein